MVCITWVITLHCARATLVPGPDPRAQMLDQVLQVLMVCAQGHTFMLVPDPI